MPTIHGFLSTENGKLDAAYYFFVVFIITLCSYNLSYRLILLVKFEMVLKMLDRSTERGDREGLEAKYAVVTTLVESRTAGDSIAAELYQRLREYAREGPLYVRLDPRVDFDTGQ